VVGLAQQRLTALGLLPAIDTPALLLSCAVVDEHAGERQARILATVKVALELRALIATRPGADPRVKVRLVVHAGQVLARIDHATRIVGGSLLAPSEWPQARLDDSVTITARALHGVEDKVLVEPAAGLFRVVAVK
jgi:hypothetical protein